MVNVSFSSIHVVNGEELSDTPQVSLHTAGKRTARSGETLLIFLDLPNASPAACADIARTLNDAYVRAPGGLTSALRLAINLANDRIIQLNKGVPPNQRLEGSISCALVTPESIIIAQAGPAIAFARADSGAFEVIAPYAEGSIAQVVGVNPSVDVQFNNFFAQPGDVYVLTGSRSTVGVSDALINACMAKGDARMVAGYLNANVKRGRMIGVALSVDVAPDAPAASPSSEVAAPRLIRATAPGGASSAGAPPAGGLTASDAPASDAPASKAPASNAPAMAAAGVSPIPAQVASDPASRGEARGEAVRTSVDQVTRSIQRSLSSFGGRLLPQESPVEVQRRARTTTFLLAAIAVLIPIAVAVLVAVLYFQFSGEAERLQLRSQAQAKVEAARAAADPAQAKQHWSEALTAIADYEQKSEDAVTFGEARAMARMRLDEINRVTRVRPIYLAELGGSTPHRIAASALGVYVLNAAENSAEYYVLNADRTGVAGKKVTITFGEGVTTTNVPLVDVAWATTNANRWRTEGAVLFSNALIYEYSSATGRASPLSIPADADATPVQVQAGELYNNTVYLLDTGVGQIWRYPLSGNALGQGNSYFRAPYNPLKESLDFAIDGAIYVLQRNGAVLKYFNRQPMQFAVTGLPEPLNRVVAIAASGDDPNRGSLYLLDAGTGSVVELNKSGQFVRQYRGEGEEFLDAQDMTLDGTSNTLYIVAGNRLFSMAVLPPVSPRETPTAQP